MLCTRNSNHGLKGEVDELLKGPFHRTFLLAAKPTLKNHLSSVFADFLMSMPTQKKDDALTLLHKGAAKIKRNVNRLNLRARKWSELL